MKRKAVSTVDVTVTRDMIDVALTQRSTLCAIALALRDADEDGNYERPWVTQDRIAVTDRSTDQRYEWDADQIPEAIKTWIDQFDRNPNKVKPFTFKLDLKTARVVPRQHTSAMAAIKKEQDRTKVRNTQKRIPAAQRKEIKHTTKRELRDVDLPE